MEKSNTLSKIQCLDSMELKIIALLTMTCDHLAAILLSDTSFYILMRVIGRVAFPIYCFLIVQGYLHTHSVKKYALRLAIMAIVSEMPFRIAFYEEMTGIHCYNVMATLLLGLLSIWSIDNFLQYMLPNMDDKNKVVKAMISGFSIFTITFAFAIIAAMLDTDYGFGGVVLIVMFYIFRNSKLYLGVSLLCDIMLFFSGIEIFAMISLIPICLYNGKAGLRIGESGSIARKASQWFFYIYYPLHISLFVLARFILQ